MRLLRQLRSFEISTKELILFLLFFLPVTLLVAYNLWFSYQNMTQAALEKRQGVAYLVAGNIHSQLDALKDLSQTLVERPDVKQAVAKGDWSVAMQLISSAALSFPSVERAVLLDPQAVLKADAPEFLGIRSQSFAHREWYQDLIKDWQPRVSNVYQRSAEPKYNVVSIVYPIKSDASEVLGILLLQIKLDSLYAWVQSINSRDEGIVYVTDSRGQIVVHPLHSPQKSIIDYSQLEIVKNAIKGGDGMSQVFDPIMGQDQVVAYHTVKDYNWGVFSAESPQKIFAARNRIFMQSLVGGVVLLIAYFLALCVLLQTFRKLRRYSNDLEEQVRQRTQKLETFKLAVKSSSNHIIITDSKAAIIYANEAAESITGYSLNEMHGKTPRLWGGLMPKKFYQHMWQTIKEDKQPFVAEITNRRKNGERYVAFLRISPILNEQKQLIGFVGTEEDISQRMQLEAKLSAKVEELERFNKLMVGRELKMAALKDKLEKIEKHHAQK